MRTIRSVKPRFTFCGERCREEHQSQGSERKQEVQQVAEKPKGYRVGMATHRGRRRKENQDSIGFFEPKDTEQLATKGAIYIVADGMGGHESGAVASDRAWRKIIDEYYYGDPGLDVEASLRRAIEIANEEIHKLSSRKQEWSGMGTTIIAAVFRGEDEVWIANVGDSRAYRIRQDEMVQLSRDHSVVADLVRQGKLTPKQAEKDSRKNRITRSLGRRPKVEVDIDKFTSQPGDTYLLCSDGLSGPVSDDAIRAVASKLPPKEAVKRLVYLANKRGGPDNISVAIVRRESAPAVAASSSEERVVGAGDQDQSEPKTPTKRKRNPLFVGLAVVAMVAVIALVALLIRPPYLCLNDLTATPEASKTEATAVPEKTLERPTNILTMEPTTTLEKKPTTTPRPGETPTAATLVPSPTSTPSPTPLPAPTAAPATSYAHSAPGLLSPQGDAGECKSISFSWEWDGALDTGAGEYFELRFWKDGSENEATVQFPDQKSWKGCPGDAGTYHWTVRIVRQSGNVKSEDLSPLSSEGTFTCTGGCWKPAESVVPTPKESVVPTPVDR